jgi:hypothetical protein
MVEWFGMVRKSEPPVHIGRRIAMRSASRTNSNLRARNAAITLDFGASTGNLAIRPEWSLPRRTPPGAANIRPS